MSEMAPGFFGRLWMALVCFFRILFARKFAAQVLPAYRAWKALPAGEEPAETAPSASPSTLKATAASPVLRPPPEPTPEEIHASGLWLLSVLQREGRFIDFLQEDVAPFSDAEVGAVSRVVHEGCRKVVRQYLSLEPVLKESEGAKVTVPQGFDAQKLRLTGNVTGQPPFHGSLKHHGWIAQQVRLPNPPSTMDVRVLAPAEVEL